MDFLYASDQENEEVPGSGWTNGSIPPSMFAVTRDGIAAQYESQRRWMSLNTSWTRIGSGKEINHLTNICHHLILVQCEK